MEFWYVLQLTVTPWRDRAELLLQADHPQIASAIKDLLQSLRSASVGLDLVTIRGLMIGIITHHAPEIFKRTDSRGHCFKCSESFVRRFLKRNLSWSLRWTTRAGQKTPSNVNEILQRACLRAAVAIRDEDILAVFAVNTDQTQVVYSTNGKFTYNSKGEKQVQVEGKEEKRAFTLVVGVSMSGEALPFQAIYGGHTKRSLPCCRVSVLCTASTERVAVQYDQTLLYNSDLSGWSHVTRPPSAPLTRQCHTSQRARPLVTAETFTKNSTPLRGACHLIP